MKNRRQFIRDSALAGLGITLGVSASHGRGASVITDEMKIGIIGLDTSHSPAFAKYINDPQKESMRGMKVVAAYPYGSRNIESSASRIPQYTKEFESMGIEIVDGIGELVKRSDAVLLETNDGNLHVEQAIPVFEAHKPLFIDKPVAGNLVDVIKIFEAARKNNSVFFSSSSLRYLAKAQEIRYNSPIGDVAGAFTYSPEHWEPTHTDLYWYGIHGVEILY
ncbi:MAG TPA: Gfo/Idh/MocA family oxidoreductase, partial [Cyclobacteriaceae bacterium]|nr:Gfo/Idh/MocA family oxidoreductase [Cyclobacteriaceae bacterium]